MRTVVIGGGISGLSLGFALKHAGHPVRVLEASERAGGSISTVEKDGFLLECGPHGFLDVEPAMQALVDTLGLTSDLRPAEESAKRRYLFTGGKLRALPTSPPAFLASDLLPWASKLRVLLEPFSLRGREPDESLARFARRHIGKRATELLIDAAQTGIYAGDVERLSASATFPKIVALEREHRSLVLGMLRRKRPALPARGTGRLTSFRHGLSTLTHALARELGDHLQLRARIERIEKTPHGFHLLLQGGVSADAERLVVATPAHVACELLAPLSAPLAQALSEIQYAPLAAVHLAYKNELLSRPLDGFGFLVPSGERRRILGSIWVSAIYPERAREGHSLLTVMIGGARNRETASLDSEQLAAIAHEEIAAIVGVRGAPAMTNVARWSHAIPQYEVGHAARLERIEQHLAGIPGLLLTGNAYRGIGLNDCVRSSHELAARLG